MIPFISPILFHIPVWHRPVHAFGVLVALGILIGVPQVVRRGKQLGLDPLVVSTMCTWAIGIGFIVSHLFDVIAYQPEALQRNPLALIDITGGLSSFGGFAGALATLAILARKHKLPLLAACDASVFGGTVGWLFGRLGCFTAHDHPGIETTLFFGVNFGSHPPYGIRHDLGLYEAFYTLLLVLAFQLMARHPRPVGRYAMIVGLTYGPIRFALDFLRISDEKYFGLTPGQYGSVVLFVVGLVLLAKSPDRPLSPASQNQQPE